MNLDLFDPPVARNTDPRTSLAGEQYINAGKRRLDKEWMLAEVREHPGLTATEHAERMWKAYGLHPFRAFQVANKRISDLAARNRIASTGERLCHVTGKTARVWVAK